LHRHNPWTGYEFPKGGIGKNEVARDTINRELKEELGTTKFQIIKKTPFILAYEWKREEWGPKLKQHYGEAYNGSRHEVFLAEFLGKEIKYDAREHDGFKWVRADKVPEYLEYDDLKDLFARVLQKYFPQLVPQ
jgi:8-oxo-dGTP pyrophosphatase MutT (NUDIX family)